jgi:cold shock CspA family protein
MIEGVIAHFDDSRGDGVLRTSRGESLYFHCVAISDGSRTIANGIRARATRAVGHLGHDEVIDVQPLN